MSAHHHSEERIPGTTAVLLAIVLPLAALTVVGLIALWPYGESPADKKLDTTYSAPGGEVLGATAVIVKTFGCSNPDSSVESGGAGTSAELKCARADARLDNGSVVSVDLPPGSQHAGAAAGDRLRLLHVKVGEDGEKTDYYAFIDFERGMPLILLALAYSVLVVLVARMRGLRALIGLGLAFAVLVFFMLPALLQGKPPLLVGLVGASAIMLVVLYFAHGFTARTTTALLGTLAGLVITSILGAWATGAARLTGTGSEESALLQSTVGSLDLSAVLLCGIVLAGLGVLNDVTITQASAVWELHSISPDLPAARLFTGAMRIGRDHIASTVYTIAFAYAGAALPVLLLLELYQRPFVPSLASGELAEEVVRTLVGSIGLVLAIPLTTAVAVAVVKSADRVAEHQPQSRGDRPRGGRPRGGDHRMPTDEVAALRQGSPAPQHPKPARPLFVDD